MRATERITFGVYQNTGTLHLAYLPPKLSAARLTMKAKSHEP